MFVSTIRSGYLSCGVRSRSVTTRAAPSMMAIQQTQSMIMTPVRAFVKKNGWYPCRPEFIHSCLVASLMLSCDRGHTATVRHRGSQLRTWSRSTLFGASSESKPSEEAQLSPTKPAESFSPVLSASFMKRCPPVPSLRSHCRTCAWPNGGRGMCRRPYARHGRRGLFARLGHRIPWPSR
jgi:hypothetical protein